MELALVEWTLTRPKNMEDVLIVWDAYDWETDDKLQFSISPVTDLQVAQTLSVRQR